MQVKDIMSKDVITVRRSTTLKQLLKLFANFHIFPLVPVIEENNHLVGIVSFNNLISVFNPQQAKMLQSIPFLDGQNGNIFMVEFTEDMGSLVVVEDIMETRFLTIREDIPIEKAYNLMKLHLKEELPVTDTIGRIVGIIGIFDIIREAFRRKGVIR